jgi:hypothetical protein
MSQTAATTLFGPMTPDAVRSAFSYLRAVEADDAEAAAELAAQEPELTQMLLDVAERVIVPVTVLIRDREEEPNASSFALAELGGVLLDALYFWQGEADPHPGTRDRRSRLAPPARRRLGPGPRCAPRTGRPHSVRLTVV